MWWCKNTVEEKTTKMKKKKKTYLMEEGSSKKGINLKGIMNENMSRNRPNWKSVAWFKICDWQLK